MQAHGIMLSEKKSSIGKESINFLGMVLQDSHYHPGPHIVEELTKFLDTDTDLCLFPDTDPKVVVHTSKL